MFSNIVESCAKKFLAFKKTLSTDASFKDKTESFTIPIEEGSCDIQFIKRDYNNFIDVIIYYARYPLEFRINQSVQTVEQFKAEMKNGLNERIEMYQFYLEKI